MGGYAVRRIVQAFVLVFLSSLAIFFTLHLVPGGPFDYLIEEFPRSRTIAIQVERLNRLIGIDRPIYEQYIVWVQHLLTEGDLGNPWKMGAGHSVMGVIMSRLPYTLLLMLISAVIAMCIALPIGIYSGVHQYSRSDYLLTFFAFFGTSMPTFWFGVVMIYFFSVALGWLPSGGVGSASLLASDSGGDIVGLLARVFTLGRSNQQMAGHEATVLVDGVKHLILPVAVIALVSTARWSRYTRSAMLEVLRQDYVRTARAKGVRETVVINKHAFRNALIPVVTVMGLEVPALFAGTIVAEIIFAWPGMGRLYFDGVRALDWPLVQGILVIGAFLVIFSNLATDLLYAVIDPRIRYS